MRNIVSLIGAVTMLGVLAASAAAQQAPDEFRAVACSRFEWPQKTDGVADLDKTKAKIDEVMQNLKANNFNAVIFQMRGQCDTLYPSPYEPWSYILSSDGNAPAGWGDFDPMAYAINAAHANGLEFHAYLNGCVAWNNANPPNYCKRHIYWEHCDSTRPDKRDWLLCKSNGDPVGFTKEYVWVAPGVPSFQAYWRKQIMYVVEHYNGSDPVTRPAVDGVHFDRLRLPENIYSYDPISEARRSGEGNPAGLEFGDWTADQITRMLIDLYAQISEYTQNISPTRHRVKVSSAPLGLYLQERYPGYAPGFQYGRSLCFQDAQAWLAAGAQDFICPQIYWANFLYKKKKEEDGSCTQQGPPYFSEVLPDWISNNSGRHVYAFCNQSANNVCMPGGLIDENSEMKRLVNEVGQGNALGSVIWSYGTFNSNNYWTDFYGPGKPYEYPANTPAMPWKDTPTDGIILGTVLGKKGPLVDVQITRSGSDYTALSSGDGLYAFLKVPPGTYTLTYTKANLPGTTHEVTVAAGQVVRVPDVYLANYTVATVASPAGAGTTSGGGTYPGGSSVTVTATAGPGYDFVKWTQGGIEVSNSPVYTFDAVEDRLLVANFSQQPQVETPGISPNGGKFTGSAKITLSCATPGATITYTTDGSVPTAASTAYAGPFTLDAPAVVKAKAFAAGYRESNVVTAAFLVTATYAVDLSASPPAGGTVSGSGIYPSGTMVAVKAVPAKGYAFVNWTENGAPVSTSPSYPFSISSSRTLVANFAPLVPCQVATSASPAEGGSTSGGGAFPSGTEVTLAAVPNPGYVFAGWTENGVQVSTWPTYRFQVNRDRTLVANFSAESAVTIMSSTPFGENGPVQVTLSCAIPGAVITYTTDGSEPTADSPVYTGPFTMSASATIKAAVFTQSAADGSTTLVQEGSTASAEVAVTKPKSSATYRLTIVDAGGQAVPRTYLGGFSYRISAPPAPEGQCFSFWSGDVSGTENPITVMMDRDKTITANYEPCPSEPAPCGSGAPLGGLAAMALLAFVKTRGGRGRTNSFPPDRA